MARLGIGIYGARSTAIWLAATLVVITIAICAPWLAPCDPYEAHLERALLGPSREHWFGTDEYGRDVFSRIVHGARISLRAGFVSVSTSCGIGTVLGGLAGYFGGKTDGFIMRLMDGIMAIPSLVLAAAVLAVLGTGLENGITAVSLVLIPDYARTIRARVTAIRNAQYIEAARSLGNSELRIVGRHILPNTAPLIITRAAAGMSTAIVDTAALGFLGLGATAPTAEWGAMLAGARTYAFLSPHLLLFPGLAITVTGLSFNLLGDALSKALIPPQNLS